MPHDPERQRRREFIKGAARRFYELADDDTSSSSGRSSGYVEPSGSVSKRLEEAYKQRWEVDSKPRAAAGTTLVKEEKMCEVLEDKKQIAPVPVIHQGAQAPKPEPPVGHDEEDILPCGHLYACASIACEPDTAFNPNDPRFAGFVELKKK
ncbi:MAG: hypothetical protein Q9200_002456 [Gallowayella weberi]